MRTCTHKCVLIHWLNRSLAGDYNAPSRHRSGCSSQCPRCSGWKSAPVPAHRLRDSQSPTPRRAFRRNCACSWLDFGDGVPKCHRIFAAHAVLRLCWRWLGCRWRVHEGKIRMAASGDIRPLHTGRCLHPSVRLCWQAAPWPEHAGAEQETARRERTTLRDQADERRCTSLADCVYN